MTTHERKTQARWHLGEWVGLKLPQLRQLLLERMGNSEAVQKRFWRKVMIAEDTTHCWTWRGATTPFGYGTLTAEVGNRRVNLLAHRISYFIRHKGIPDKAFVCHSCDNPACVNPDHLFLGANRDNQLDKVRKKRHAFSENHGKRILSCEKVQQIRVLSFFLKSSCADLAELFGISYAGIASVIDGKNWKHLPLPECLAHHAA